MSGSMLLAYLLAVLVLQLGVGGAVAYWRWRRAASSRAAAPRSALPVAGAWAGWREFRVARREYEDRAHTVCSFHLEPVDGAPLPPFIPGQFLTFEVPISDASTLIRCYSLSDGPNGSSYRISVKRLLAPVGRPDLPEGACSNQLHDRLQVGDLIKAKAPAGRFVFDPEPRLPVVLIAGGIGITPLLSMLRGGLAAEQDRTVHLYYGVRNGAEHGFRKELEELGRLHPAFNLNVVYSQPDANEVLGQDYQASGYVDLDLLGRTLLAGRRRFYVCGPPAMMASLIPALDRWGVMPEDLRYEAFGPASARSLQASASPEDLGPSPSFEVTFRKSGRALEWNGQDTNHLDFAERHQLSVESGCRSGSCGACEVKLTSGTGPLLPAHAELAGDCFACHLPFRGAASDRCVACHVVADIGVRTTSGGLLDRSANRRVGLSFHQELVEQDCSACHIGHGRLTERHFSHALLRPATRGNCAGCHAAPTNDLHRDLRVSCDQCHTTERWSPAGFDHAALPSATLEKCEGCHAAPSDSFHRKITTACTQCHNPKGWKPSTFKHDQFFVLDGDHNASCETCHSNNDFTRYTCFGCHEHTPANIRAEHEEEGIRDLDNCVSCHRSADGEGGEHGEGRERGRGRERGEH